MSARHAAAARVIARTYGFDTDTEITAARALKAADRLTYSKERLEDAAEALWNQRPAKRDSEGAPWPWEKLGDRFRDRYRQQAATVAAVLQKVQP